MRTLKWMPGALCLAIALVMCPGWAAPKTETVKLTVPDLVATRGGGIVLKVADFGDARAAIVKLARKYDAELRRADAEVNMVGEKHGELVLQVDAPKLDGLMDDVRKVGKLYSEQVRTTDKTSYCETLDRRTELLRQNESELLNFLRSPRRMRGSDLLFVQYRLYQTRVEAANATQERLDLTRRSHKSLLSVMLFEPQPKQGFDWRNWHAMAAYRSKGAFFDVSRKLLTVAYTVLWFAPLWVPAAIVLFLLVRWIWRKAAAVIAAHMHRYDNLPAPPE